MLKRLQDMAMVPPVQSSVRHGMTEHAAGSRMHGQPGAVNVLGVPVAAWDVATLIDAMIDSGARRSNHPREPLSTVHYANVHVLNVAYRNQALRDQLRAASTVYCDGSGVRLGARLLGKRLPPRLTAADWIDAFCARAASDGVSLFFLGGAEGVADRAAGVLCERHPGLQIAGTHHGFLDATTSPGVIRTANETGAGVLLVGMGTPIQELWLARHRARIEAPVAWTIGALLDFVAGVQRRAPAWVGAMHLEWLWRLGTDPTRLAHRYLLGNPLFCARVLRQRSSGTPAGTT